VKGRTPAVDRRQDDRPPATQIGTVAGRATALSAGGGEIPGFSRGTGYFSIVLKNAVLVAKITR
jgi:hypothetical protein